MSGWSNQIPRTFTAPDDAGPNDPRLVFGPDVPAPIATIDGVTIVAAIIWFLDDDHFHFYALGASGSTPVYRGTYAAPTLYVFDRYSAAPVLGKIQWTIGDLSTVSPNVVVQLLGAELRMSNGLNGPLSVPFLIDGRSAPRGTRVYLAAPGAPLVASTGPEVTAATSAAFTFVRSRAYRFRFRARVLSTLAGQSVTLRLRAGSAAASVGFHSCVSTVLGDTRVDEFVAGVDAVTGDVTSTVALTIAGGTGANPVRIDGTGTIQAEIEVQDIGAYNDFLGCTAIV